MSEGVNVSTWKNAMVTSQLLYVIRYTSEERGKRETFRSGNPTWWTFK